MKWIYDIESFPNLFLLCAKNTETKELLKFQISQLQDDRLKLLKWLQNDVEVIIGFNNLSYDYPMLHHVMTTLYNEKGSILCKKSHEYSNKLVKSNKFIKRETPIIKQIDLFKINHYDNKARITSLKLLQFNLKLNNIQELPYPVGTILNSQEIQNVIDYCDNDVLATEMLYYETISEIDLRIKLSDIYKIDFTNFNSTKVGEYILLSKITEKLGEKIIYDFIETDYGVKKTIINTKRDFININDVIFSYVQFTSKPFKKILNWFKLKIITQTKGVFSEIPFSELTILEPYYQIEKKNGKQQTLNVIFKNLKYDFGVGGIHASIDSGIYEANDDYFILDIDVESYYPNLAIKNSFYPLHLTKEFCNIYENIFKERQTYNKKTHPTENMALKLALNGAYGKSNSEYSALYDPLFTMKVTINGQLLLCMLSERLMEEIPNIQTLQMNTDGTSIRVNRKYKDKVYEICKRWEKLTNLGLEYVEYSKMIIKDVNNYLAIKLDGNVKRKGAAFIYKINPGELELHKNFSMLIVPKALEAYFVYGKDVTEFIMNHNDIYDFFKRTKINKQDKLFLEYENKQIDLQRVTRYYISGTIISERKINKFEGTGGILIKEMPPLAQKETKKMILDYDRLVKKGTDLSYEDYKKSLIKNRFSNIEAGYLCTECNDLSLTSTDEIKSKLNYQYYIDEVYKIINQIENKI